MGGFKLGDVIAKSRPYVFALNDCEKGKYCDFCFNPANNLDYPLKRCSQCKYMFFCDVLCQKKAWKRFHKRECPALKEEQLKTTSLVLSRFYCDIEFGNGRHLIENIGTYTRNFDSLESHAQTIRNDPSRKESFESFKKVLQRYLSIIYDSVELRLRLFAEIFCKLVINSFEIANTDMIPIGVGLYLGASIFDHSCDPDAVVLFDGTACVIRALRDIPHDDLKSIYISYIDTIDCRDARLKTLKERYYFTCKCFVCEARIDETAKLEILDINETLTSEVYAKTQALLLDTNLNNKTDSDKQTMLEECLAIETMQDEVLGPNNVLRVKVLLLGFDLSIHLSHWETALRFGELAREALFFYRRDDLKYGTLLLKLGKICLLDNLDKGLKILYSARNTNIARILGESHPIVQEMHSLIQNSEMEISLKFRELDV